MPTSVALGNHFETFIRDQVQSGRFNNVSEEWQSTVRWAYWDRDQWKDAEAGFSSRLCELIGDLP